MSRELAMASDLVAIGLNTDHDGGCAIVRGTSVVVAIAEERLNRTRYSPGWHAALAYCLEAANVRLPDVDIVVFSCVGPRLDDAYTGGLERLGLAPERIATVDHHLSHAYSAYCLSGFDDALVVVADGAGNDNETESYFLADTQAVHRIGGNDPARPHAGGIGPTYDAVTNFVGFHEWEAGKTMALAAYGDPHAIGVPLFDMDGPQVEGRLEATHERGLLDFAARCGIALGEPHQADSRRAMDLAAWVQAEAERALAHVVTEAVAATGARRVCLAGGVALNCVANTVVRRELGPQVEFFVPAPASDRGQALGNALYGIHYLTGAVPCPRLGRDAFGRTYTDDDILLALRRHPRSGLIERHPRRGFTFSREADPATAAAQLITAGGLVAYFDGGSELGARALGQRSILADPRDPGIRDRLNQQVKHREWFRPFAPAVLDEHREDWFDGLGQPSPFMLFAVPVSGDRRDAVPAVTHVDGTARVQTVDAEAHPAFHKLIQRFADITGVPVVLNTSFNDREPIVETPAHAVATFASTDLDALVIGDYVAVKDDR